MHSKKRIIGSKKTTNSTLKKPNTSKSINLLINSSHLNNNIISIKLGRNETNKSNSVDKTSIKNAKINNKNKNSSKVFNLNLPRQSTQGTLYSLKNYINDIQYTYANHRFHRQNSYILNENKTHKLIELLNNKIKKKRKYLETYNNNSIKDYNNYNKQNASLSSAQKKKNLSQGHFDYINLDEYYDYNNFKSSRNQKKEKKGIKEIKNNHLSQRRNYNRYDKNKCVIERKMYGGNKGIRKNLEKIIENKALPNLCENINNKNLLKNIKLNKNKEINANNLKKSENNSSNKKIHLNINIENQNNNNINISSKKINSTSKLFIKSETNNILNASKEDLMQSNNIESYNRINNNSKEIKLKFPSINKYDINNESSQESTSQIGNTFSNKITINSNIGYRKEKFISSFLDGPEDIHCRFVELHKQRKMFYENLCNKFEEDGNSLDNNKVNVNDFEKNEYSEYFENYNENVPLI